MKHTTQVLSDEQIEDWIKTLAVHHVWGSVLSHAKAREFARAIESATLKAVKGQEPVAWAVEYGAISLPQGHQSRITAWEVYATKEAAEAAARAMDFDSRILPVGFPHAQPAPVDELEIINGLNAMRNLFKWWLEWDKTPNELGTSLVSIPEKPSRNVTQAWVDLLAKAETHIAALQCAQAPQATKGQP